MRPTIMKKALFTLLSVLGLFSCGGSDEPARPPDSVRIQTKIVDGNGQISPDDRLIGKGGNASFSITPDEGYSISRIEGCGSGEWNNGTYSLSQVNEDCELRVEFFNKSSTAQVDLSFKRSKVFRFDWDAIDNASHYKLLENIDGSNGRSGFVQIGNDIPNDVNSFEHVVPLYFRLSSEYILQTCFIDQCIDSPISGVDKRERFVSAIGVLELSDVEKVLNAGKNFSLALSDDGLTMVVGNHRESFINNDTSEIEGAGEVSIYILVNNQWEHEISFNSPQPYENASFGKVMSLSRDGRTLAITENQRQASEPSQNNTVHLYHRNRDGLWAYEHVVTAHNIGASDRFGESLSLNFDGSVLAVGAPGETSSAEGVILSPDVNGWWNSGKGQEESSGAVYMFKRIETDNHGEWSQIAFIKAEDSLPGELFGSSVTLNGAGDFLGVSRNGFFSQGVIYAYEFNEGSWAYSQDIRTEHNVTNSDFGNNLKVSTDGNVLIASANLMDWLNDNSLNQIPKANGVLFISQRKDGEWHPLQLLSSINENNFDHFSASIDLSSDGKYIAVSSRETSNGLGVETGDSGLWSNNGGIIGAVYLYEFNGYEWVIKAFLKPISDDYEEFATDRVRISGDASSLVAGAINKKDGTADILLY